MLSIKNIMLSKTTIFLCSAIFATVFPVGAINTTYTEDGNLVVLTDKGYIKGVETPELRKFLGIPYAAPPVGNLRWRQTKPAAPWFGVRDASKFAPHCAQSAGAFIGEPSTSEDCLYLNVFTPKQAHGNQHAALDARDGRPVMVWIYGGGFTTGYSNGYDPTELVTNGDVVVVTINYRLGALGFLAHPALTAESPQHQASGNYSLMDQQEALRWVKRNIRRFGGDPNRVTIFGESSGGVSVHALLASPLSYDLFHRAIIQSGAFELETPTLAAAEARGLEVAAGAGCSDQTASCLRSLSVETLLAIPSPPNQTIVDGFVLPRSVREAYELGKFNKVPVLQGSTKDEFRYFYGLLFELSSGPVTPEIYPFIVAGFFGNAEPILREYPLGNYASIAEALSAVGTDGFYACPGRASNILLSAHVPTFAYEFNDVRAPQRFLPPISIPYGAYHAAEIQYLFDFPMIIPADPLTPEQEELAGAMKDYWTTFARTGDPRAKGEPLWPRFRSGTERMLSLETPRRVIMSNLAAEHHCAFWASFGQ
jgi:para-nitrobenzyl esterase